MVVQRIKIITLGGLTNRELSLEPGLNVLCGPNGSGKSTLRYAITLAFDPTIKHSIEETNIRRVPLSGLLPVGGGDTLSLEMELREDNEDYRINWKWQDKPEVALILPNGNRETKAATVAERIAKLRGVSQFTWNNLLLTPQGALQISNDVLKEEVQAQKEAQVLRETLRQAVVNGGPVPIEGLVNLLRQKAGPSSEKVSLSFNWNYQASCPQNPAKTIDNPYETYNRGPILDAYYAWKTAERNAADLESREMALQRLTAELQENRKLEHEAEEWLDVKKALYERTLKAAPLLAEQKIKDHQISELLSAIDDLQKLEEEKSHTFSDLRLAEEKLTVVRSRQEEVKSDAHKKRHYDLYQELIPEVVAFTKAKKTRDAMPQGLGEAVVQARQKAKEIDSLRAKMTGNKLSVRMRSTDNAEVTLTTATGKVQHLSLPPGQEHREVVSTMLKLDHLGLTVEVEPEGLNTTKVIEEGKSLKEKLDQLLKSKSVPTIEQLEAEAQQERDLAREMDRLDKHIHARLNSFQQGVKWKEFKEVAERIDPDALLDAAAYQSNQREAEMGLNFTKQEYLKIEKRLNDTLVKMKVEGVDWSSELESRRLELSNELSGIQLKLIEFQFGQDDEEATDGFLEEYQSRESTLRRIQVDINRLKVKLAEGERDTPSESAAELRAQAEHEKTRHQNLLNQYRLLRRVLELVEPVVERFNEQAFVPFQERLSHYLHLTLGNRYGIVEAFSEDNSFIPEQFAAPQGGSLQQSQLSRGSQDSVALATRLALAEFYLPEGNGLLVLDDPCVEMDEERRAGAISAIQDFATRRQTLVLTCHPAQADLLGGQRTNWQRLGEVVQSDIPAKKSAKKKTATA